ncbi:MAG: signal peptidase I [Candidatus Methanofastidiosia archaeon]
MDSRKEAKELIEGILIALVLYFTIQAFLVYALGVEHPIVVVISSSMEPTYYRGDILIVEGVDPSQLEVGDIIVFNRPSGGIPIVHRIVEIVEEDQRYFITKGDHNSYKDSYWQPTFPGIPAQEVVGDIKFRIPMLGKITLFFKEIFRILKGIFGRYHEIWF